MRNYKKDSIFHVSDNEPLFLYIKNDQFPFFFFVQVRKYVNVHFSSSCHDLPRVRVLRIDEKAYVNLTFSHVHYHLYHSRLSHFFSFLF